MKKLGVIGICLALAVSAAFAKGKSPSKLEIRTPNAKATVVGNLLRKTSGNREFVQLTMTVRSAFANAKGKSPSRIEMRVPSEKTTVVGTVVRKANGNFVVKSGKREFPLLLSYGAK